MSATAGDAADQVTIGYNTGNTTVALVNATDTYAP